MSAKKTILTTNRLLLEEAQQEDTAFFFELLNSPNWIAHIGDRNIGSIDDALAYINSLKASYEKDGFGLYKMLLKQGDVPIGICGLVNRETLERPDIGFAILPRFEGHGYTTEAAKAMLRYATDILQIHPVLGITTKENLGSRAILEKIGLAEVGTVPQDDDKAPLLKYSN